MYKYIKYINGDIYIYIYIYIYIVRRLPRRIPLFSKPDVRVHPGRTQRKLLPSTSCSRTPASANSSWRLSTPMAVAMAQVGSSGRAPLSKRSKTRT